MAAGGGGFLGGGSSNTLVAFALPDVPRKPLPVEVSQAVAAAARRRRGRPQVGSPVPLALPPGGIGDLVERRCAARCHALEVVTSQRMSAADWDAMVRNMIAHGAQVSEPETRAIVSYLARHFGPDAR
jgi:hypothetical protein